MQNTPATTAAIGLLEASLLNLREAMRTLGHEDDGCRLGAARIVIADVLEDLRG